MISWRWYARWVTLVSAPFALFAQFAMPSRKGAYAKTAHNWQYLDLVGNTLILGSMLCLNLSLTFASSTGWRSGKFIGLFVASWPLLGAFFFWEARIDEEKAVLPPKIWKIPNVALIVFVSMYLFSSVASAQLPFVERFEVVYGVSEIKAAVRMLPLGVGSCLFLILVS